MLLVFKNSLYLYLIKKFLRIMNSAIQFKQQPKQSKHPYTSSSSNLNMRKQGAQNSVPKLSSTQTQPLTSLSCQRLNEDSLILKSKNEQSNQMGPTGQTTQQLSAPGSSQKQRKNSNVQPPSPGVTESFIMKQKFVKTPYQENMSKKQINYSNLSATPNSSAKKSDTAPQTGQNHVQNIRAGSNSVISDSKPITKMQSQYTKPSKRESLIQISKATSVEANPNEIGNQTKHHGVQRSLSRQTLEQRLEKQNNNNHLAQDQLQEILEHSQSILATENEHEEFLPNFQRYKNYSEFHSQEVILPHELETSQPLDHVNSYFQQHDEDSKLFQIDQTNEEFLEKQNHIPTEISNSIAAFNHNSGQTIHSRYAVRKPYFDAFVPRSPNAKNLPQVHNQIQVKGKNELINSDQEITDLSNSENNSAEDEIMSKISKNSSKLNPQFGRDHNDDIDNGSSWNQEIYYNQQQDSQQLSNSMNNPSPKSSLTKKTPYSVPNYGSGTVQNKEHSVQYINNLNNDAIISKSLNSSKNGSTINASSATTLLASANNSVYSVGTLPQQMTQMPKPVLSRPQVGPGNIAIEQVNLSYQQKLEQAHSPLMRQQALNQQFLIQNPSLPSRKILSSNSKNLISGSSANSSSQNVAFINRVQVSPINNNFGLSRENTDSGAPLIISQINNNTQSLKKQILSTNSQQKFTNYLLSNGKHQSNISSGNLSTSNQSLFSGAVQSANISNNTQRQSQRRSTAVFTPGSIPQIPIPKLNKNVQSLEPHHQGQIIQIEDKKVEYESLIRVLALSRYVEFFLHLIFFSLSEQIFSPTFRKPSLQGSQTLKDQELNLSLHIENVVLDQPNQNVIAADSQRTRFLNKEAKVLMIKILTFYVKHEQISYKQGLNEILLPFLWLEFKHNENILEQIPSKTQKKAKSVVNLNNFENASLQGINSERIFLQFKGFIDRYLPNIFINDEFIALQSCMTLLRLLFKYHAPQLYCFLEKNQITIEMYAIPWIITYFSTKMDSPELVLQLWNKVAEQPPLHDISYIFFFAVALMIENQRLIQESDFALLPVMMASLRIKDQATLQRLFAQVHLLQENTPFSFSQLPELHMIMKKTSQQNLFKIWKSLESLDCLPLLPAEIFFYCFPDECGCSNPSCANSLTYKKSLFGNYMPIECTSICKELSLMNGAKNSVRSQKKVFEDLRKFESEDILQSGVSSLGDKSSPSRNQHLKGFFEHARHSKYQAHQIETESNLNCDMDYQESPIDLINETAKMKHLNVNENRGQDDQVRIAFLREELESPDDFEANSLRSKSSEKNKLDIRDFEKQYIFCSNNNVEPCNTCQLRKQAQKTIDLAQKTKLVNESFEDLSPDLLVNKIRFIAIDCRLNTLKQEATLPHSLNIDLNSNTKVEQLKVQVEKLSMFKETHHICLIGLTTPELHEEDIISTPKRKISVRRRMTAKNNPKKLTLKDFHSDVLHLIVELFVSQGFKHLSTLPGGFSQAHDIAFNYGLHLVDHNEVVQKEQLKILSPTRPQTQQQKRCYHCKIANYFETENTPQIKDINQLISIKEHGSPAKVQSESYNSIRNGKDCKLLNEKEIDDEDASYYLGNFDNSLLVTSNSNSSGDGEEPLHEEVNEKPKVRGFDLSGGWDYIPFGLRQVYEAATSINKMLADRHQTEQTRPSEINQEVTNSQNKESRVTSGDDSGKNGAAKKQYQSLSPNKTEQKRVSNVFPMAAAPDNKEIISVPMRQIRLSDDVHERDSSNKNKIKHRDLSMGKTNARTTLNLSFKHKFKDCAVYVERNPKDNNQQNQQFSSIISSIFGSKDTGLNQLNQMVQIADSRSNDKMLNDIRNASYQNYQHLQQQTQYKLISKVPEYQLPTYNESNCVHKIEVLNQINQDENCINQVGSSNSPLKRNRPRINCEVKQSEVQFWKNMQSETQDGYANAQSSRVQNLRKISDTTEKMQTNLTISNVYSAGVITNGSTQTDQSSRTSNISSNYEKNNLKPEPSVYSQSQNEEISVKQVDLPILPPREESYLLNGLVNQVGISQDMYLRLTSEKGDSQVSFVFTAVRLPARKKSFAIRTQQCFNSQVPSKILITPFTVAILHKESDLSEIPYQSRMQTEEIDSMDFEENDQRLLSSKQISQKTQNQQPLKTQDVQNTEQRAKSFATLQSRFFMYDLIKITSRKSTTKIITFYFRIPKLADYPAIELEKPDILQRLNSKPATKYAFAFKRSEYEEVSMSFEFEQEEQAKNCISNVSNLYKKLKNTQKRHSKKQEKAIKTEETDMSQTIQVQLPQQREPQDQRKKLIDFNSAQQPARISQLTEKTAQDHMQPQNFNRNSQNQFIQNMVFRNTTGK